jgi:uncharacterized membrane protein
MRRSTTIGRPIADLYAFWRDPEHYPQIMDHLTSVERLSDTRSRWQAKGPAGIIVTWEAEFIEDAPSERLVWRSVEGAPFETSGSIHFRRAPKNLGTEVTLLLDLQLPGGRIGDTAAKVLGYDPGLMGYRALHRFKALMETGEIPTTEGQPAARGDGRDVETRNAETPTPAALWNDTPTTG